MFAETTLDVLVVEILGYVTLRILLLDISAIYKFPLASTATPDGAFNCAVIAKLPSPLKPDVPLPATVEIIPERVLYLRITLLPWQRKMIR